MKTAITNIIEIDNLKDDKGFPSIARVNRDTGELYVNKQMFAKIPPIRRKFILFHEAGHATLNTKDEKKADDFALRAMLAQGESLTEILKSLTCVLDYNKPSHYDRTAHIFEELRNYDLTENNNQKVKQPLKSKNMFTPDISNLQNDYDQALMGPAYSDFLGMGKKAAANREARSKRKDEIAEAKAEAIKNGTFESTGSKIIGTLGKVAGKFLGGGGSDDDSPSAKGAGAGAGAKDVKPPDDGSKNKTIIIIVVVMVVIIIVGFIAFRAKKH